MAVAVSGIIGRFVDGPADGDATVLPQPAGVLGEQIDLPAQIQLTGKGHDQCARDLRVPVALRPFGRLPVHRTRMTKGENLPSLASVVMHEAGTLVRLAGAGGIGPRRYGRFAVPARNRLEVEMENGHADLRAAKMPSAGSEHAP